MTSNRIVFNVSGEIYETFERTLQRFPETLLGTADKRKIFYCLQSKQYFFDRNRQCFAYILFFYQSNGILRCPADINLSVFEDECKFFQLPREIINAMKVKAGLIPELQKIQRGTLDKSGTTRAKVWNFLENPESSTAARNFTIFSVLAIFLSIIAGCIESVPTINPRTQATSLASNAFLMIEFCFNFWFLIELTARFSSSPSKRHFMKQAMNWIDAVAIIPYFVMLCISPTNTTSLGFLRVLRLVRIFRLVRLNKLYSQRLQIVSAIIRSGIDDLKILSICLFMTVTLVGCAMYYIENSKSGSASTFVSIPVSGWWAIVTMTTSGYGDIIPMTLFGRFVATVYMLFGAMTITLPALSIGSKLIAIYEKNVHLVQLDDEMLL